jgi:hypothetical protein
MAGRLQEGFKTAGVIFSVIVSIFSFTFTFLTFYFEHLKTSEAVDASLSIINPKLDSKSNLESATVDLLLLNKGDSSITVSDLWFEIDVGAPTCCQRMAALKVTEDTVIVPILLPSMQASKITVRFKLSKFLPAPWGFRLRSKDDPPQEPLPPPPPINVEKMVITIEFTTIGPNYGLQVMKMPVGTLYVKDERWTGYSPEPLSYSLTPIRKDPSFFKSMWNSLAN